MYKDLGNGRILLHELGTGKGYEIWHVVGQDPLQGRFIENCSKGVREV
jgi:hypothetical protein